MSLPGVQFEELVEQILRILTAAQPGIQVERDVHLEGPEGTRQIDVLVRSTVGPFALTTIIECKDFIRKIDVTKVDALHSLIQDVRASKGVIVSRKGFSGTAIQKARRLGISLLRADRLDVLRDLQSDIPIHVKRLEPQSISVRGTVHLDAGATIANDAFLRLNDADLRKLFRDELLSDKETINRAGGEHQWTPKTLESPLFFRDVDGLPHSFESFSLGYVLGETHFFGYLSDMSQTLFIRNEIEKSNTVLFPAELILNDQARYFAPFSRAEDMPVEPQLSVTVLAMPNESQFGPASLSFQLIQPG